jgi:hypothetical protein
MKRIILFIVPLLIFSCEFNVTKKKDLLEDISYSENGLVSDDVYTLINGKKEKRNQFIFGEKIEVVFNTVTGFSRENGMAYPELKLLLISEDGQDTINYMDNLISGGNTEGTLDNPIELNAFFTNTFPVDKYKLIVKGYDLKGDGYFNFSMPFEVIKNERISVMHYGLKSNIVYLFDETTDMAISDNIVDLDHKIHLIINGIKGFDENDSIIFPKMSMKVTDVNEKVVFDDFDMFKKYGDNGLKRSEVEQQINAYIQFTDGEVNNPYKLEATFIEKKSGKKIDVFTFLNFQN